MNSYWNTSILSVNLYGSLIGVDLLPSLVSKTEGRDGEVNQIIMSKNVS